MFIIKKTKKNLGGVHLTGACVQKQTYCIDLLLLSCYNTYI